MVALAGVPARFQLQRVIGSARFLSLAQVPLGGNVTGRRKPSPRQATKTPRRKAPRGRKPDPGWVQRAAAADHFDVEPSRINKWVADGAPVARRGKSGQAALYDLKALERWRVQRKATAATTLSLVDEKAKLAQAQRQKIELEQRVRRGELVESREVEADAEAVARAVQRRLLLVVEQAVREGIIPREQKAALRNLQEAALRELSALGGALAASEDEDDELEATA